MDRYDQTQEDSYDGTRNVRPSQIEFMENSNCKYGRQNSVGTTNDIRLFADEQKYSTKVHTFAWATIVSAIVGVLLSVVGMVLHDKSIGLLSVLSIAMCGISLMIWIESARRERNFH